MKVDLLNGKLNKTYFSLLVSAIASTIVATIYSTVDMICVGHYAGPDGSAAIACTNPMWALMFAFGMLFGIGGAVMMSNKRGAGKEKEANEYYTVAAAASIICSFVLLIVSVLFMEELMVMFGAEGNVLTLAVDYMNAMAFSIPTFTMCACLSTFMRNDGEAIIPTVATVIGGVLNMILDVTLVFGFDMGVAGAGLATAIGQVVAFAIILSYFFTKKCSFKFTKVNNIAPILLKIATVGFSAFLIEITWGITSAIFNLTITKNLSTAHLAVYGTASTVTVMFYSLFNGIGTAVQPLIATSFGAANGERIKGSMRLAFISALSMGVLFVLLCELFPETILRIYMDVDESVLEIGPRIIRLYSISLPVVGISLVCNYFFQSTLHRSASVAVSILRGVALPVTLVLLLPMIFGYDSIWLATPISEILTCAVAIIMIIPMVRSLNKQFSKAPSGDEELLSK